MSDDGTIFWMGIIIGILIGFFTFDAETLYHVDENYEYAQKLCEDNDGIYSITADQGLRVGTYMSEVRCNNDATWDDLSRVADEIKQLSKEAEND